MIIRSQDKKTIVNFSNVTNICCGKDNAKCIYADFACGEYEVLGEYSTEEKAIKVLDMICEEYKKYTSAKGMSTYFAFIPPKVFQMPSDEEVEV